jgi:sugar phosphate isomerase/epimerase
MLIGAMNHPQCDVIEEIQWMAAMGLEFVDLTLEPPRAASWKADPRAIRAALDSAGLDVVGHTAYYLPIGSPIEDLRLAAVAELRRCIERFAQIGVAWMNIHPDHHAPMHDREFCIQQNLRSLEELLPLARQHNVGLMLENLPGDYNTVAQLAPLLDSLPEIGLHLDIGHANLRVPHNTADELIRAYGPRLRHVHLHDNKGGDADLHLPLGSGTVDFSRHLRTLRACGYDATITLEVFCDDRHYLAYSRDVLRRTWEECGRTLTPSPLQAP